MKALKLSERDPEINFTHFPERIKDFIKESLLEGIGKHIDHDGNVEEIEFERRDGFTPFSHNKGGITAKGFTDLAYFWGGGNTVSHEKAQKEIYRKIESSFDYLKDDTYDKFKDLLGKKGITKEQLTYHAMEELSSKDVELEEVFNHISSSESEYLSDDSSSIMLETRFLYHGYEDGTHSASVSAAVNTEGPYHRSHIPWAPDVFCEGSKEIEIEWRNEAEFKKKFIIALKKCVKSTL